MLQEKKATRMRDTCQQKLEALGGNGVPSVHPTNGTLHAGGGDDAPGPRSNPVRAPSPTPVVQAPSPTPVVRAASPTPHTLRAASPLSPPFCLVLAYVHVGLLQRCLPWLPFALSVGV